jgi:hypothetical protein
MEPDYTKAVDDPNARGEKQKDTITSYREGWDRIWKKTQMKPQMKMVLPVSKSPLWW